MFRYSAVVDARRFLGGMLAGCALILGIEALGAQGDAGPAGQHALRNVVELWNRIRADYVVPVSDQRIGENCIRGVLSGLDPHSTYIDTGEYRGIEGYASVGLVISRRGDETWVADVSEGSSVSAAGIKPGSTLLGIDGRPVWGLSLAETNQMLHGQAGTDVRLDLLRTDGSIARVTANRQLRSLPLVVPEQLSDGYQYVRLPSFASGTSTALSKVLAAASSAASPAKGLILDLRYNSGGPLNEAVDTAALFLDRRQRILRIPAARGGAPAHDFNGVSHDAGPDYPERLAMVVLVNADTSSGAEIVAAALQDHHRATVMGETTAGNADLQTVIPLPDGAAIKLTTNYWLRPSGNDVEKTGVVPDLAGPRNLEGPVPAPLDQDALVRKAVSYLKNHPAGQV